MRRFSEWVLGHRLLVVLFWLVVTGAGAATAGRTVDRLSYDFGLPGQPAYEANLQIRDTYGGGGLIDPLVLTVGSADGTDLRTAAAGRQFAAVVRQVVADSPGARVVTGVPELVSPDGRRAVALVYPVGVPGPDPYAAALPALQRATAQARVFGAPVELTGTPVLEEGGGDSRGVLIEIVLGAVGALVVLALVFGSLLAFVPLRWRRCRSCRRSWPCSG